MSTSSSSFLEVGSQIYVELSETHERVPAVIRYKGRLPGTDGNWIGVEFFSPLGKNDGSVKSKRYFTCPPSHGLFVRPNRIYRQSSITEDLVAPILTVGRARDDSGASAEDDKYNANADLRQTQSRVQRISLNKSHSFANSSPSSLSLNPPQLPPPPSPITPINTTMSNAGTHGFDFPSPGTPTSTEHRKSLKVIQVDMKDLISKLINSSEFRSNLQQIVSKSTTAERVNSLESRMVTVADSLLGIQSGMGVLQLKLETLETVVTSAEAEEEIKELKSALNHVSMMAKCAFEATKEERSHHAAEILRLQGEIENMKRKN